VPLSTENGSRVVNQLCAASRQGAALSYEHLPCSAGLICEVVRRINKIVQSPVEGFLLANVGYPNPTLSVNTVATAVPLDLSSADVRVLVALKRG